MRVRTLRC